MSSPDRPPYAPKPSFPNSVGQSIGQLLQIKEPMGAWTGLTPTLGAPLSGLLIGGGLGGLYAGGRYVWDRLGGRTPEKRPWWKHPAFLGALGGTTLGALSGLAQVRGRSAYESPMVSPEQRAAFRSEKAASVRRFIYKSAALVDERSLVRVLDEDPNIPFYEKDKLIGLARKANSMQLRQMAALAAVGSLTAAAAHTIMGTGFFGSAVAGGLSAMAAKNLYPGRPRIF